MPSRGPSGPWQRLKPVDLDPLEGMGLPSKGETRLLDHKQQERYYTKIVERYLSFCSDAVNREALLASFSTLSLDRGGSSSTDNTAASFASTASNTSSLTLPTPSLSKKDLSSILMALRKLREGIVASGRLDDFSTQAYLLNIRISVLSGHPESYHPAILFLLGTIHPSHPLTSFELREVTSYLVLDAACRLDDLARAFTLRHRYGLCDSKVNAVLRALVNDNFVSLARIRRSVDGHKAKLIDFCADNMRRRTLKVFGRAYLSVDIEFLEQATETTFLELVEKEGVGWERDGSDKVIIRKIKGRSA